MRALITAIGTAWLSIATAGALPAQRASSETYFLVSAEHGSGGTSQTAQYVLTAAQGSGVVAARAVSGSYVLEGGFVSTLAVPVTGAPMLTGVLPRFATMRSGAAISLHGTELDLGPIPTVLVGGQPAAVAARTTATITTTLPAQPAPGWQPVEVQSALGSAVLSKGIGVLPMLEAPRPVQSNVPGEIVYRGSAGDLMVLIFALGPSPVPIPLPPFGHALEVDLLTSLWAPPVPVTDPSGVSRFAIPAIAASAQIHVQAFGLSSDPGYAPGSFTNAITIF